MTVGSHSQFAHELARARYDARARARLGLRPCRRRRRRQHLFSEDDHNSLFDRHVVLHESEGLFGRTAHALGRSQERRGDLRKGTPSRVCQQTAITRRAAVLVLVTASCACAEG